MDAPDNDVSASRRARGLMAHLSGAAAEDTVARHYQAMGWTIVERRLRSEAGEVDLIATRNAVTAFVEVKQSATIDAAIASLRPAQLARIAAAAEGYFLRTADGLEREMRIDLAAVDRAGRLEILENLTLW